MISTFNGTNTVLGGLGDDMIFAFNGTNTVLGEHGDDKIFAITKKGANVAGGFRDDLLLGGQGNDLLQGNSDNDFIVSGGGNDKLIGGSGNDVIIGGPGNDTLDGGLGDDTLIGGLGPQRFICGPNGVDTIIGYNQQKGDTVSTDCNNATYKSKDKRIGLATDKIYLVSEIGGTLKIPSKISKLLKDSLSSLSIQDLVLLQQHMCGKCRNNHFQPAFN